MIVVRLLGGLGNQLFQYAVGRALALRRGDALYLDASGYDRPVPGWTPRHYELDGWRIRARRCDPFRRWTFDPRLAALFRDHARVVEPSHDFDPGLFARGQRHLYLDGYWQCERYFESARAELLAELTLEAAPAGENARLLEEIRGCNAVAVHVRRSDYADDDKLRAFHGLCTPEYYRRALAHVAERVDGARFYFFSDDPGWVRQNLSAPAEARYVSHNGADRGAEDLRLMRACRAFVIANSSFSWWGAWLAEHPEKLVIAPERWFADPREAEGDIVPRAWSRM